MLMVCKMSIITYFCSMLTLRVVFLSRLLFCTLFCRIAFFTFESSEAAAECVKNGPVEIDGKSYNVEMASPKGGDRGGDRGGRGGVRGGRGGGFSPRGGRGGRGGGKSLNLNGNKYGFLYRKGDYLLKSSMIIF